MIRYQSTVLFVHASADLYGSDITLLQLVYGLDRDKFSCIVVVPYNGPLVPRLREAGAETIVYPDLPVIRRQYMNVRGAARLARSSLRSSRWLVNLIRRRDVALVHSNTLAVSLTGLAAKVTRRPHVCHVHEIVTRPRIVATSLATLGSAMSTLVVANSRATAEHCRRTRLVTSTPVKVILNGVDESRLRDRSMVSLRSLAGAAPEDIVFTLVGRINRWKGHSVFIDAAERLAAEYENVRFLIVGDSFAGQEHLTEAVDRRIKSSSILRARTTRFPHMADVGSVYKASDIIVVPSTEPEPFGLVAAEAMAAGLPVIAARIGALPEIVDDRRTGILISPNDITSLLAAMRQLSDSQSYRAEMGREAKKRFERCFRVERYVEDFSRIYSELLKKGRT